MPPIPVWSATKELRGFDGVETPCSALKEVLREIPKSCCEKKLDMKITFISPPPNLSGGQRVIAIYADQLHARGHDVVVIATRRHPPDWKSHVKAWARGKTIPKPPAVTHFQRMRAQLHLLDHEGPVTAADIPDADVVIATWWETAFMVAQMPPEKGRKFYFIQHHEVHAHLPAHISACSYYLPLRKITVSGWLRDTMAEKYGDKNVVLVPNSVDTELFHAPLRGKAEVPTVGLMYATEPFKGVDIALCALRDLQSKHQDLQIVAFGARPVIEPLRLPPNTRYHIAPKQDELRSLYAACDVFLTASRSEGFGLPILEAMACRTPVVATRTGCAEDVIKNGVEGYVVEPEDAIGLSESLQQVLALPEAGWQRMSNAAHRRATLYTWDDATDLFEHAVQTI